jgi:glycosyltransferase involved in cell wall biosynthesis
MRICILGHYPPHIGGVSSHTYLLSKQLRNRGDEVYVLTYPHPDVKNVDRIKVETAPAPNIKGFRGFFFFITATFKLMSMVRQYDINLIHAHFLIPPGLIGVIVGSILGKKTAVTAHGSDLLIHAKNPLLRPIIKFVLKKADYVLVVNQALKDNVLEMGITADKIYFTPNAVDTHKFNPQNLELPPDLKLNSDKPTILFVGNLVAQKGVKYLLKAKKLINSDAVLLIVGDGPLRGELEDMVKKEGIDNVVFTGARRDVGKIMPSAKVLVLPSVSEGFPITILEALSSGLPVVATRIGGVLEVIDQKVGIIVEPSDPTALAEAVDKIFKNNELRDSMKVAARERALKYSYIKTPY